MMEEDVEVIGRQKPVDLELDSEIGNDFTVEWWRDNARSVPIAFTEVQMVIHRPGGPTLDVAQEHFTIDGNTCRVKLPPSVTAETLGAPTGEWDMKWFFQGTNASGVVMIVRGKARHK